MIVMLLSEVTSVELNNKELSLQRAQKYKHKPGYKYPVEKRIELVTAWLQYGNLSLACQLTGIGYDIAVYWKRQAWWPEMVEEIKASRRAVGYNKLSLIVDKALDIAADRLEKGDIRYNKNTGEMERVQVNLRDAAKVATDLMQRQEAMEKLEDSKEVAKTQESMQDTLKALQMEFAKFNKTNTGPVSDAVVLGEEDALSEEWSPRLQARGEGIHESSRSEEEESGTESSETGDGESGPREEG
jgi:hypothetical protein